MTKGLGEHSREELEAMFGRMYTGWDRGVIVDQPEPGKFTERPMTEMELEARYVAAEIGINIFEIANQAAFAPIVIYNTIQKFLEPVFETQVDEIVALREEIELWKRRAADRKTADAGTAPDPFVDAAERAALGIR